jgi:hypothetical protein
MIQKNKQKRGMAIIQVAMLIVSIFAIGYILSGQIGIVSAIETTAYCNGENIGPIDNSCTSDWDSYRDTHFEGEEITCEYIWGQYAETWEDNILLHVTSSFDLVPAEGIIEDNSRGAYCEGNPLGVINVEENDAAYAYQAWEDLIDLYTAGETLSLPYFSNSCGDLFSTFMSSNPECAPPETVTTTCGDTTYSFSVEAYATTKRLAIDDLGRIAYLYSQINNISISGGCDYANDYLVSNWDDDASHGAFGFGVEGLTALKVEDLASRFEGREDNGAPVPLPTSRNPTPPVAPITVELDGETYTQQADGSYTDTSGNVVTAAEEPELYERIGDKVALGLEAAAAGEVTSTITKWIKGLLGITEEETVGNAAGGLIRKATGNPTGAKAIFKSFFDVNTVQGTAFYATAIYFGTRWLVGDVLNQDENTANAWATGLTAGFVAYQALSAWTAAASFLGPYGVGLAAVAVAATTIWLMLQKEDTKTVAFTCQAWQPEVGGENCERCNDYGALGCTEYQCRSLGVACSLVNQGTPDQKCFWNDSGNINPPMISVWDDVLRTGYRYTPIDAQTPIDRGAKVVADTEDGCVPAFSIFDIGFQLDQFGSCRIDHRRGLEFDEMLPHGFGGSSGFSYNHSQAFMFPGGDNLRREGIEVPNGGEYKFYVKCMSANGHISPADFEFQFCIHDGPDMMAPIIYGTNEGSDRIYVPHNTSSIDLQVYINEPSECKWDFVDKEYQEMLNEMTCSDGGNLGFNGQVSYPCDVTLDSIEDDKDNNYYFRCLDQPDLVGNESGKRHAMTHSYPFTIAGTKSLAISSVGPDNETITGSTSPIRVTLTATTEEGADSGNAWCQYSESGDFGTYYPFTNTEGYSHSTEIRISPGEKEYFIQCYDKGSNFVTETTKFKVESDETSSIVVRAYKDDPFLKIITNEPAECVYDIHPEIQCGYSFEEGTAMTDIDSDLQHYVTWQAGSTFYIKCRDGFGNKPDYDTCSVIVKPFDI